MNDSYLVQAGEDGEHTLAVTVMQLWWDRQPPRKAGRRLEAHVKSCKCCCATQSAAAEVDSKFRRLPAEPTQHAVQHVVSSIASATSPGTLRKALLRRVFCIAM